MHLADFADDAACEAMFRFRTVGDMRRLAIALGLPDSISTVDGHRFDRDDAIMYFCARLASKRTLQALCRDLGRSPAAVSQIMHWMYHFLWDRFFDAHLDMGRWSGHLETWADAVAAKGKSGVAHQTGSTCKSPNNGAPTPISLAGAPLDNCWGFVDGTLCPMQRPSENQREFYNGHKHRHGYKFLGITAPNGLCVWAWGALPGRRSDAWLVHDSGLLQELRARARTTQAAWGKR